MWHLLYPRLHLQSIFDLDPEHLRRRGIKGIITDMDNTLVPWNDRSVYPRLSRWLENLKEKGFFLYIISNSTPRRGKKLAGDLEIPAIWYAIKPRRRAFRKAIKEMNLLPRQVAVVGDQIFTDILGGNRLGLYTILVSPLCDKEFFWTRLLRLLEVKILERQKMKK